MAGAAPLSVLIAASNVATLSEDRVAQFPNWISHLRPLLFPPSSPHDLIVLHLQEVGGVKWTNQKVVEFADRVQSALLDGVSSDYWSSGLVVDMEPTRFTALGTIVLVRRLTASRFRRRHFASGELVALNCDAERRTGLVPVAGHEYFRHEKFEGSSSRKGFLVSEWSADGRLMNIANVHLYHDDSNLVALECVPSVYAVKRAAALRTVMQRLPPGPAMLAGDFNFRLDLAPFVAWIRQRAASATAVAESGDAQFLLVQKDVFQCPFLDAQLRQPELAASVRHSFDQELPRFNNEQSDAAMRLIEEHVSFPPTYPIEGPDRWSAKRAPGWCDRVLYTPAAAATLFHPSLPRTYNVLRPTDAAPLGSDHLPVYLHFYVPQGNV